MFKVIFFISIFYFSEAFACKMDMSDINALDDNPSLATVFLVGTIVGSEFRKVLNVNWPLKMGSIKIDSSHCLAPRAILNKDYLYLSNKKIDTIDKMGIGKLDGLLIELKDARKYIDKLAMKKEIKVGELNLLWKYCQENKECVEIKNTCNVSESVNKKYKSNYDDFMKNSRVKKDCKSLGNKKSENNCINYFCN